MRKRCVNLFFFLLYILSTSKIPKGLKKMEREKGFIVGDLLFTIVVVLFVLSLYLAGEISNNVYFRFWVGDEPFPSVAGIEIDAVWKWILLVVGIISSSVLDSIRGAKLRPVFFRRARAPATPATPAT